MISEKIKIWHVVFLFSLTLILLRIGRVIELYEYILNISNVPVSFQFFDVLFSILLIIMIPVFSVIFRKVSFNNGQATYSSVILIALMFTAVFSPVIALHSPDKHHELSVAKLLPPLSSLEELSVVDPGKAQMNIWPSSDEEYLADEIELGTEIVLVKNNTLQKLEKSSLILGEREIVTKTLIFPFGTDEYGRDIFSRIVYGTRLSIFIGMGSVIISSIIGIFFGFTSGYSLKIFDNILNRVTEMFMAFPIIFLIILLLALFGNSIWVVIAVLGFSGWMSLFKIVRGEVVEMKQKDFVVSSKMLGYTNFQILRKEILPGIISPIIVNLIFLFGNVIIAESALSFLGLGISDQYPTWGAMINQGQYFLANAWWLSFFPCLFLSITLISANNVAKNIEQKYQLISVR